MPSYPHDPSDTWSVGSSTSSQQLFAARDAPRLRLVFNDSTSTLFVKYGTGASTSAFTVKVAPGGYYEFPVPVFRGVVSGVWDTVNGNARMTEVW